MDEKELAALKESNPKAYESYMNLKGENDKLKTPPKKDDPPPPDDKDLADKARIEREKKEKDSKHEKSLTAAITFNHASKDFVKANAGLLPKSVEGIFAAAEKETYDSAIEKSNAIKVGIVQEYFAVQANHDLLTASQKIELDEFLKLTKNGKQDRIENIYAMIFEPTIETARKIEKARQVNDGRKDQTDAEKAYTDRMKEIGQKHFLGDKK